MTVAEVCNEKKTLCTKALVSVHTREEGVKEPFVLIIVAWEKVNKGSIVRKVIATPGYALGAGLGFQAASCLTLP